MQVWNYCQSIDGTNIHYCHIFIGNKGKKNFILIKKSLVEFGIEGASFKKEGSRMYSINKSMVEWLAVQKWLIQNIFNGKLDIKNKKLTIKPLP